MQASIEVLAVRQARKSYGSTVALADASLSLRAGEWIGLLGPNGAGKTTLIRAIAGRVRLDSGEITLFGRNLSAGSAPPDVRDPLGIVPQDLAIYPKLTARENLEFYGRLHGVAGGALSARVDQALVWTGLQDRANHLSEGYSGGMKRRLNIACATLHQPRLVLLDEPTVGVDPQSRERIWEMLAELRAGGATLLLTTHQLDEAQKVCERIVIIDHGRVIAVGTMAEILAQTTGTKRRVYLTLDRSVTDELCVALGAARAREQGVMLAQVDDVASDLPPLLTRLHERGVRVQDVHIEAPSLQAAFLQLTGRELRE